MRRTHAVGCGVLVALGAIFVWLPDQLKGLFVGFLVLSLVAVVVIGVFSGPRSVSPSWLVRRVQIDDIDLPTDFLSQIEKGDEVWEFKSPAKTWRDMHGRAGYVIVRDGHPPPHTIVTVMH